MEIDTTLLNILIPVTRLPQINLLRETSTSQDNLFGGKPCPKPYEGLRYLTPHFSTAFEAGLAVHIIQSLSNGQIIESQIVNAAINVMIIVLIGVLNETYFHHEVASDEECHGGNFSDFINR